MKHPVFDGLRTVAWTGDPEDVVSVQGYDLEEMLYREFDYDAFAGGYGIIAPSGDSLEMVPRLTSDKSRPGISAIRSEGGEVYLRAVFVDLDRQPHDPWPDEDIPKLPGYIQDLATLLPEAAIYATTRGLRVVFKLRRFVTVEDYRRIAQSAMRYVAPVVQTLSLPVVVDSTAQEWDRLVRLPHVLRNGQRTAEIANLHIPEVWVGWYPGRSVLAEVELEIERKITEYENRNQPRGIPDFSEKTEKLFEDLSLAGPPKLRPYAKMLLEGTRFYAAGDRNNKTWEVMRWIYSVLRSRGHIPVPEELYAVFYNSVAATTGTSPEEALAETWSMAQRLYARELALQEVDKQERINALEAARDTNPPVAYTNKARWVWNPEKRTYGLATTDNNTFLAEITAHHPLTSLNDQGKPLPLSILLRDCGVRVHGTRQILGQRGARLTTDASGRTWLEVGVAEIVPIKSVYHQECQDYLDQIVAGAGERDGRLFLEWLATCIHLQDPTTALVLRGASGAGKDMLAETLSRIFGGKAAFRKSMDRFNSQMLDSALIHLNEGIDDKEKSGPVANRFREVVAGGTIDVEQKGIDPTMVVGNYRIIITANNPHPLPVQNTKTLEDFRAIAQRVLHVWVDQSVTDWLEARGAKRFTHDWVDRDLGDTREPGKLAEHIMWLSDYHPVRDHGARFLVPANVGPWHVQSLLQGILRDVLYAAGVAATSEAYSRAVGIHNKRVWVTADVSFTGVVNKICGTNYEPREVKAAIRSSLVDGKPKRMTFGSTEAVYFPMPMDLVLPILEPEDPDVYIEEAEQYNLLVKLLEEV